MCHFGLIYSLQDCRIISLLSESAPLSIQLKARFFKLMCKALVHDNSTLKYVTSLPESYVCERKELARLYKFCTNISMISMNVNGMIQ